MCVYYKYKAKLRLAKFLLIPIPLFSLTCRLKTPKGCAKRSKKVLLKYCKTISVKKNKFSRHKVKIFFKREPRKVAARNSTFSLFTY